MQLSADMIGMNSSWSLARGAVTCFSCPSFPVAQPASPVARRAACFACQMIQTCHWLRGREHLWGVCAADYSVFVGDLAPDVTDYALQENFRHFFASVRSAKVCTRPLCAEWLPMESTAGSKPSRKAPLC